MAEKGSRSKWKEKLGFLNKKKISQVNSTPKSSAYQNDPGSQPSASSARGIVTKSQGKEPPGVRNQDKNTRIERVLPPPLLAHPSLNSDVLKAQRELQKATEELEAELEKYMSKFSEYAPLQDEDVKSAMASTREDKDGFRKVIEQVLSDQKAKSETIPGKVAAFMGNVYPTAGFVLGIVSFAGDAAGVAPLKITANAVNAVLNVASKQQIRSDDILSALPDLKTYDQFFARLQKLGFDRISDPLLEAATKLFLAITKLLGVCLASLHTNAVTEALKALKNDKLANAKNALASASTMLDYAINQEQLFDEKNRVWREECEEALMFLSNLPTVKEQDDVRNRRMKGSGKWILQDETFLKWIDGELKTVWCPGKPGAGKTFVCSTVIDHCRSLYCSNSTRKQNIEIAWLYCSYSKQAAQTIDCIFASIIKQLVASLARERGHDVLKEITKFLNQHREGTPSLEDYLKLMTQVVGALNKCVVIIDALDECTEIDSKGYNREWLVKTLIELKVQLLVTSRDLPVIQQLFEDSPNFGTIIISPDPRDIQSYIHWKIFDKVYGSPKKLRDLIAKQPVLLTEITAVVTEKYSQIFNLTRLQMEQISKLSSAGDVRKALKQLPMKESDFYGQSIQRIRANETQAEQSLLILAWVLRALRPMYVEEMKYAGVVVPGDYSRNFDDFMSDEGDLVDRCEGLVVILPESRTLAFAHPTVHDYLESAWQGIFNADPKIIVASACITYLASDYLSKNPELMARLPKRHGPPSGEVSFSSYAISNWLLHTRGANEKELLEFIIELFTRNIAVAIRNYIYSMSEYRYPENECTLHTDGIWIASGLGLENTVRKLVGKAHIFKLFIFSSNNVCQLREITFLCRMAPGIVYSQWYPIFYADAKCLDLGMGAVWEDFYNPKEPFEKENLEQPLLLAVERGYFEIFRILLDSGAKLNGVDGKGNTALHYAAREIQSTRSRQFLEALISLRANIEARNVDGETPLHVASRRGSVETVKFLLDNGADIEARDNRGETPLAHAVLYWGFSENMFLLLERGADVNSRNNRGNTPLHTASSHCLQIQIQTLLEYSADVDVENKSGESALDILRNVKASWYPHYEGTLELLQKASSEKAAPKGAAMHEDGVLENVAKFKQSA